MGAVAAITAQPFEQGCVCLAMATILIYIHVLQANIKAIKELSVALRSQADGDNVELGHARCSHLGAPFGIGSH